MVQSVSQMRKEGESAREHTACHGPEALDGQNHGRDNQGQYHGLQGPQPERAWNGNDGGGRGWDIVNSRVNGHADCNGERGGNDNLNGRPCRDDGRPPWLLGLGRRLACHCCRRGAAGRGGRAPHIVAHGCLFRRRHDGDGAGGGGGGGDGAEDEALAKPSGQANQACFVRRGFAVWVGGRTSTGYEILSSMERQQRDQIKYPSAPIPSIAISRHGLSQANQPGGPLPAKSSCEEDSADPRHAIAAQCQSKCAGQFYELGRSKMRSPECSQAMAGNWGLAALRRPPARDKLIPPRILTP